MTSPGGNLPAVAALGVSAPKPTESGQQIVEGEVAALLNFEGHGNTPTVAATAAAPRWLQGWEALRATVNQTAPTRIAQLNRHIDAAWRNLARG